MPNLNPRAAKYSLTPMQRGGYRAECWMPECGWWLDTETKDAGLLVLRGHMRKHHVHVTEKKALAGTGG